MITTDIIRDTAGFRDIESEWSELLQACSCNCLFLSWEWMYTWWLHLAGNRKLHIIVVRNDGLLVAIAPLALSPPRIRRLMPFRVLEFLASDNVGSDYLSFIIRNGHEQDARREIARCLTKANHMLEMVRVEKSSHLMADMTRQLQHSEWDMVSLTTNKCPCVNLFGHTWESYFHNLKSSHRKRFAYYLKRLHKEFSVELKAVASESECQAAMGFLISQHLSRWSKRGGSTAFNNNELISFHQAFSRTGLNRGWLRLYTLKLDGVMAAVIYIYKYDNVFYFYQTTFNSDYGKYSVGKIILGLAIKNAIAEGAAVFDFLHDDEAYKSLWTRDKRELIRIEFYPPGFFGHIYRQIMQARSGIKHLSQNLASYRNSRG